jgi:tRNA nucleotidyltransferase (CCA-adding enzyme)
MLASFLALPLEQLTLLRLVADEASARGLPVYIVGGFVRDLLMGQPSLDLDIVVVGDAVSLARALARKHGGKLTAHPRFGTATIENSREQRVESSDQSNQSLISNLYSLDFITARRETYAQPAALPDVTPSTIEDDIRRRDFTINTLAVRLDGAHFGELYDLYNGASDIERGLIRVLHPASFLDDPTRMFRAVRYEQRYGFTIAPESLALIPAARPLAAALSAERARHELDLIFDEARAASMLARLDELGLLKALENVLPWSVELRERLDSGFSALPAPAWDFVRPDRSPKKPSIQESVSAEMLWFTQASMRPVRSWPFPSTGTSRRVLGYSLWLLDLTPAEIAAVQARLTFPLAALNSLRAAARLRTDLPALSGAAPSKWVERLGGVPLPAIYAVYLVSAEKALETYASHWQHIHPKTDGDALKTLGVPPGPAYKKILLRLRAAWLDGEVASAEQEKILLEKLLTIFS